MFLSFFVVNIKCNPIVITPSGPCYNAHTDGFQFTITDCQFIGNSYIEGHTANGQSNLERGGAFHINFPQDLQVSSDPYVSITNTLFYQCYSKRDGAICVENFPKNNKITMKTTCMRDCYSTTDQFSVGFVTGDSTFTYSSIINCNNEENSFKGGAFGFARSSNINLENMNISDNYGKEILYVTNVTDDTSSFKCDYLYFQRNKIDNAGIFSESNIQFTINNCNFVNNNESLETSSVVYIKADSSITSCIFKKNVGYNIYIESGVTTINDCYIDIKTIFTTDGSSYNNQEPREYGYESQFTLLSTELCPHEYTPPRTYPPEGCEVDMTRNMKTLRMKVVYSLAATNALYQI